LSATVRAPRLRPSSLRIRHWVRARSFKTRELGGAPLCR
jgi:hypothetical protein